MPDITIAGATFRNVPQIDIPKDGGGTASFIYEDGSKSITENGTHDVSGFAEAVVNVSGGGGATIESLTVTQNGTYTAPSGVDGYSPVTVNVSGGASNYVHGEFTPSKTGAQTITVPYTGSGYPIAVCISVKGGYKNPNYSDWYDLIAYQATGLLIAFKCDTSTTPDYYGGAVDYFSGCAVYKSSTSSATSYKSSGFSDAIICAETPTSRVDGVVRMQSATSLAIYGRTSGYGFIPDITYEYHIIYSE